MTQSIEQLIHQLSDASPYERRLAVIQLGQLAPANVVDLLLPMLEDRNKQVRIAAVTALGELRDRRAVEPLLALWRREAEKAQTYSDPEDAEIETVHPALISNALRTHFGALAVDALIANLDLFGVIYVLGEIGDIRAVEPLIAILEHPEITFSHTAAIMALGKIGDARALPAIRRYMGIRTLNIGDEAQLAENRILSRSNAD